MSGTAVHKWIVYLTSPLPLSKRFARSSLLVCHVDTIVIFSTTHVSGMTTAFIRVFQIRSVLQPFALSLQNIILPLCARAGARTTADARMSSSEEEWRCLGIHEVAICEHIHRYLRIYFTVVVTVDCGVFWVNSCRSVSSPHLI